MSKITSLIWLANSLSKSEKKAFNSSSSEADKDYLILFKLIDKQKITTSEELKKNYEQLRPNSSFNTAATYLFNKLLNCLSQLNQSKDNYSMLLSMLMDVRTLFEKKIYSEGFQLLTKIKEQAAFLENEYILLMARRMELDYLTLLEFNGISEKSLLNRQMKLNESLKVIRKLNEQSALYELLRHRIDHKGSARSSKQKNELNDLVVSEMSVAFGLGIDNFQIKKTHQLFQSNYLLSVGDYKSALNSFYELSTLFDNNKHLWNDPPTDYKITIEGVLESLRSMKKYTEMLHYVSRLKEIETSSLSFQLDTHCVIFLYTLFPLLDRGHFSEAMQLMSDHKEPLLDKTHLLSFNRQAQLSLYTSLIYFANGNFSAAKKSLQQMSLRSNSPYSLPLFRVLRLVRLMISHQTGDYDLIVFESRSIRREIRKETKSYRIENLMLKILNKQINHMSKLSLSRLWKSVAPELTDMYHDKYESQLLRAFDFTAWIESTITKESLCNIVRRNSQSNTQRSAE